MILQKQPSKFSCLPTAFAMVVGIDVADVITYLGHDDALGFHPMELSGWALTRGWVFTPFDDEPELEDYRCKCGLDKKCPYCEGTGTVLGNHNWKTPKIGDLLAFWDGVLIGERHAVAWSKDYQKVYDPNFTVYGIEKFDAVTFWMGARVCNCIKSGWPSPGPDKVAQKQGSI